MRTPMCLVQEEVGGTGAVLEVLRALVIDDKAAVRKNAVQALESLLLLLMLSPQVAASGTLVTYNYRSMTRLPRTALSELCKRQACTCLHMLDHVGIACLITLICCGGRVLPPSFDRMRVFQRCVMQY